MPSQSLSWLSRCKTISCWLRQHNEVFISYALCTYYGTYYVHHSSIKAILKSVFGGWQNYDTTAIAMVEQDICCRYQHYGGNLRNIRKFRTYYATSHTTGWYFIFKHISMLWSVVQNRQSIYLNETTQKYPNRFRVLHSFVAIATETSSCWNRHFKDCIMILSNPIFAEPANSNSSDPHLESWWVQKQCWWVDAKPTYRLCLFSE